MRTNKYHNRGTDFRWGRRGFAPPQKGRPVTALQQQGANAPKGGLARYFQCHPLGGKCHIVSLRTAAQSTVETI